MPFSSAVNLAFLRHYFESVALGTPPTGFDVIAYTTTPNLAGASGVEAAYTGYSRITFANSDANWEVETLGSVGSPPLIYGIKNSAIITLPTPGSSGLDITGIGLAIVGTNTLIHWGSISPARPVISGVELTIPIGSYKAQIQVVS
jgi:hypothetical protein